MKLFLNFSSIPNNRGFLTILPHTLPWRFCDFTFVISRCNFAPKLKELGHGFASWSIFSTFFFLYNLLLSLCGFLSYQTTILRCPSMKCIFICSFSLQWMQYWVVIRGVWMLFYRDRATTNRDNVRLFLSFLFLSLNEDLPSKPSSEGETLGDSLTRASIYPTSL